MLDWLHVCAVLQMQQDAGKQPGESLGSSLRAICQSMNYSGLVGVKISSSSSSLNKSKSRIFFFSLL